MLSNIASWVFFMVTVISLILMKKIWETDTFPLCFVNADIHPQIFIWFTTVYNDVVVHVIQDLQLEKCFFFKQQFFSLVLFLFYVHICQVNTCMNRIDVTEM